MNGDYISATREIFSAQESTTPKILTLSYIGDGAALEKHSFPAIDDNPEVGKNHFDHLAVGLTWKLKHPEVWIALGSPLMTDPFLFDGWPMDFIQFGQASIAGLETILQGSNTASADRELLLRPEVCHIENVCLYAAVRARMSGVGVAPTGEYITTLTVCVTPTSRGSVMIASSDLRDPLIIDVYFNTIEVDRYILREGLKETVRVMRETKSGQSLIKNEVVPECRAAVLPDLANEIFDKRIRDFEFSLDHPCGSCAMGKVVDSECKVFGARGLRVVDASIFPIPVSAHPQVYVYALAEKAATVIAQSTVTSPT